MNKELHLKVTATCDTGATSTFINENKAKYLEFITDGVTQVNISDESMSKGKLTTLDIFDNQRQKKTKVKATIIEMPK